jgi:hypothetical protein
MLHPGITPSTISWRKWVKFAFMSRAKVVKFFMDAYQLNDSEPLNHQTPDVKEHKKNSFPSVGRKAI